MADFDRQLLIISLFACLRRRGFQLGIGELLAAVRLAEGPWREAEANRLQITLRRLWCHAPGQIWVFQDVWMQVAAVFTQQEELAESLSPSIPSDSVPPPPPTLLPIETLPPQESRWASEPGWSALPIQAPFVPASTDEANLHAYLPVSQRQMAYAWRYLRRLVREGPADELDVPTTVERAARQGYYLAPAFRRRLQSHAHVLLLIDQGGSMTPFHRFTRDMVNTARGEPSLQRVDVVYFHNVLSESGYLDSHLTEPLPMDKVLADCSSETSILIVSDAGAARGYRRLDRIRTTMAFLHGLEQRSVLITWLNPMPETRWPGTSAQIIAYQVPMFPMSPEGFSNAIDLVRGQPLRHYR